MRIKVLSSVVMLLWLLLGLAEVQADAATEEPATLAGDNLPVPATVFNQAETVDGTERLNSEALFLDAADPLVKAELEAEARQLIDACTGYNDATIKAFSYLYAETGEGFDYLYFRLRAYNAGSYQRLPGVLEFKLKFKKYHSGEYEQGIDSGRYYWGECG